ncbi:MAG TPA: hypothetical protein VFY40_20145 [Blastocatellia bacterium]|nr:hypothetical protein [Blastocatellia bacterium]
MASCPINFQFGHQAIGSIINYLTRSTLSVAAPALMQDLRNRSSLQADTLNSFQPRIRWSLRNSFVQRHWY